MLAGLDAYTPTFLSNVNAAETRINAANEELSSGYRVNQPSDDPGAIVAILGYQSQIDNVTQIQVNLTRATTNAGVSDGALASAGSLLNQLASIAAEGLSSSTTAGNNNSLAQQVEGIGEQMVALANTTFAGSYVFGGDDPNTQPYTSTFSANPFVAPGYSQNNTANNTVTLTNSDGDAMAVPSQTAQQIFDTRTTGGAPVAGNILQNISTLVQALQSNNQTTIQAAGVSINASITQLGQATTISGNTLNWLQTSTDAATSKLTDLQLQVSGLRDADATQAATDLTTAQTALQAAIAAQGTMNIKTLFSYLG